MDYKDLFNRYKNGDVTEEEKQLIEEEIEKFEIIEDYLSESFEEEFARDTSENDIKVQVEETKKIKKSVNDKLKKVVWTSVLIVVALYIGIFYILSGIVDRMYYNPTATTQSEKGVEYKNSDFYYDMHAYVGLNLPGYSMNQWTHENSKGFASYDLTYYLTNHFTRTTEEHIAGISRNGKTFDDAGISSIEKRHLIWMGFEDIQYNYQNEKNQDAKESWALRKEFINKETIHYLNELNPLSYISMNIVFDEDLTLEEFFELEGDIRPLDVKWVGVRTVEPGINWKENQPLHLIGFNPSASGNSGNLMRPNPEKYPMFNILDFYSGKSGETIGAGQYEKQIAEVYRTHFRSRLEYISNRKEFINLFDYNSFKFDFYKDALDYIDEHGTETYGILVYGTAEDFLKVIDRIPYASIYIKDVLPVKPMIYYD